MGPFVSFLSKTNFLGLPYQMNTLGLQVYNISQLFGTCMYLLPFIFYILVFKNHSSGVMSVAFCGDILLSCGADGTMKKRSLQGIGIFFIKIYFFNFNLN